MQSMHSIGWSHLRPCSADHNGRCSDKCLQVASSDGCSTPPELSLLGDTELMLDGGSSLRAHSQYLPHASTVFEAALTCCTQAPPDEVVHKKRKHAAEAQATCTFQLPLPGASRHQVLLLLHSLYAFKREAWVSSLNSAQHGELAAIAHKFGCEAVLELVDSSLVSMCQQERARAGSEPRQAKAWLCAEHAPEQFKVAQKLQLRKFEARVGQFLGSSAPEIDLSELDHGTAAVLRGACQLGPGCT